jgi:hypothetical protein
VAAIHRVRQALAWEFIPAISFFSAGNGLEAFLQIIRHDSTPY